MPCDAVIVDVVEDRQARLGRLVDVELGVVWLRDLLMSGLRPRVVSPSDWVAVGWLDLLAVGGPEPSVEVLWKQVFAAFATCFGREKVYHLFEREEKARLTVEIAQATRGPDVWNVVLLDQLEDEVVLFLGLDGDGVHAVLAANVTSLEPVDTLRGQLGDVSAVEVVVALVVELLES